MKTCVIQMSHRFHFQLPHCSSCSYHSLYSIYHSNITHCPVSLILRCYSIITHSTVSLKYHSFSSITQISFVFQYHSNITHFPVSLKYHSFSNITQRSLNLSLQYRSNITTWLPINHPGTSFCCMVIYSQYTYRLSESSASIHQPQCFHYGVTCVFIDSFLY